MDEVSIGIDASADTVAICAVDASGEILGQLICEARPAIVLGHLAELGASPGNAIGIEAGGCGTALTRKLRQAGHNVRVLDARYVSGFLKLTQNKTDRNDAQGIAEIMRSGAGAIPDVLVKAEAVQMLRSELVLRHRMMAQRIALENAVRGTFRLNGGRISKAHSGRQLGALVTDEIDRLREEGCDLSEVIQPVVSVLVELRKALEQTDRRLVHRANDLEVCRRFMTIPGVGTICSLSFYTAIENPDRFVQAVDVGPYLGLVPRVSQSGTVFRSGRISRMGNMMTRTHLVTAATSMMRQANKDSDLRRWAIKVSERAGWGKARVALARKLATVMIAMWKSGEPFRVDEA